MAVSEARAKKGTFEVFMAVTMKKAVFLDVNAVCLVLGATYVAYIFRPERIGLLGTTLLVTADVVPSKLSLSALKMGPRAPRNVGPNKSHTA
jgi:hypothetical protein